MAGFGRPNRSVMNHEFSSIPSVNIERSSFNRSSGYKTTFDAGYLVPVFVDEVLPGDTFSMKTSMLARMATPIAPIMDNLKLDYFFFFVPNRLVWDNWPRFNGEQTNPGDSTDFTIPQLNMTSKAFQPGDIGDYFGLPTDITGLSVNALPFRAYNLIYNEWFRDENLIDSVVVNKGDEDDSPMDYNLLRRGKRHDYFTSCLPWPQKGDGVELSLGTPSIQQAPGSPLVFNWVADTPLTPGTPSDPFKSKIGINANRLAGTSNPGQVLIPYDGINGTDPNAQTGAGGDYFATGIDFATSGISISAADDLTINSLRQAFQLQRLLERDARGGTRYTEIIRSHFGVISPDARLQRPEYLGGGSYDVNINPVMQTSSTDPTTPQGNLSAFGVAGGTRHGFSQSFVEHGFIIGLVCVRADLTYQQGIHRMWSRETRFDHYWPTLAHLGEQAVLNKEIYARGDGDTTDDEVFGYQERFAEYRYGMSKITGKMRSNDPQTLELWHLSQYFQTLPTLNQEFIEENPPIARVIAVPSEPHFLLDCYFDLKCARPMPVYSVPGYIDHF